MCGIIAVSLGSFSFGIVVRLKITIGEAFLPMPCSSEHSESWFIHHSYNASCCKQVKGTEVMGRYGFKERNVEGQIVVAFAKRIEMAVVNTYFKKKDEHRVTYKSGGRCTQVDYVLCRRCNLKEIGDCKVLAGDSVARQHRMVVCRMALEVKKKRRRANGLAVYHLTVRDAKQDKVLNKHRLGVQSLTADQDRQRDSGKQRTRGPDRDIVEKAYFSLNIANHFC
ncbi:hypothetical protein C0J45_3108 [Silurus meridionalis]|nr:hypothetical protein C0J45_3108 [Silurus meridionalis]